MPFLLANPYLDAVLVAILLYAVLATWDTLFGPLMRGIASAFDFTLPMPRFVPDISFHRIGDAIRHFEQVIRRALGTAFSAAAWPFVMLLTFAASLFLAPARELYYLTRDVTATLDALVRHRIPAMIAAKVAWIPAHLNALEREIASLARRAPIHITKDITNYARGAFTTIVHKATAVPWPRIRAAERDIGALWKRIKSQARRVPVALTAAALTAIVARTSFRWVRCSKVSRFGKQVCGMDESLLESLLADTLLVVGTISIVEFAEGMQAGMDEFAPQIRKFWRA